MQSALGLCMSWHVMRLWKEGHQGSCLLAVPRHPGGPWWSAGPLEQRAAEWGQHSSTPVRTELGKYSRKALEWLPRWSWIYGAPLWLCLILDAKTQRQRRIFMDNSPNYGLLGQRSCLVVGVGWCCSLSTLFTGPIWTDLRCKDFWFWVSGPWSM